MFPAFYVLICSRTAPQKKNRNDFYQTQQNKQCNLLNIKFPGENKQAQKKSWYEQQECVIIMYEGKKILHEHHN